MQEEEGVVKVPMYAEALLPFYLIGLLDDEPAIRDTCSQQLHILSGANAEKGCYAAAVPMIEEEEEEGPGTDPVKAMIKYHLKHITMVCKRDLTEWTTSKKLSAARLLYVSTQISGAHIAPYLELLVPLLCNAVGDEHEEIAQFIVSASHHIGSSCEPSAWLYLVLDVLRNPKATVTQKANAMVILAGLVHGCSLSKKPIEDEALASLTSILASEEIRGVGHYAINGQVLSVIINLLEAFGEQCKIASQDLYRILLQLQALPSSSVEGDANTLQRRALDVTATLANLCGYDSPASFASDHSRDLLHILCGTHGEWTKDSPDQFVFSALLFNCSVDVLEGLLDAVFSVFKGCLHEERDPHIRLETLKLLDRVLEDDTRNGFVRGQSKRLLAEVLLPPAVWQVGETAASIRFHAIVVLGTFFRKKLVTASELASKILMDDAMQVLPTIHSCLEEDYYADTRLASCHTLEALLNVVGPKLTDDQKRLVYPELLKRLDDSNDQVRIQTCATLRAFVCSCLTPDYCDTNTGYLLKGMLVHMDDTNPDVQEAVCSVAENLAKIKPHVTRSCLHEVRDQHRKVTYIDRVLGIM